ncbi:Kae1-associated serine/threonine protein kinase [Candidatus Micrarchaeota archaeon]|nr:Kae1-associated serine/threonine protein kinase [Candidatus Micrarchaeota archaeon]
MTTQDMKIIGMGAEAIVYAGERFGLPVIVKHRIRKDYREPALDKRLRTERTRREVSLMVRAKKCNVLCPVIVDVEPYKIIMTELKGRMLHTVKRMKKEFVVEAARILARLHEKNIVHGDFTPANLMIVRRKGRRMLAVIDFGLGFFSQRVEDKAMDVLTMKKALDSGWPKRIRQNDEKGYLSLGELFVREYAKQSGQGSEIEDRVKLIESRVRYAER